ncbi:phage portal protein [Salmonella enterica]|nr:phage portal protein [Salmonella enterica]EEB1542815.1 phage portal protein [Salmonella enterica]
MKRTPVLVDVHGTPLRESLGYTGGGIGFGGQMADWMPPAESVDAALLPSLRLGNARADDLVRNNGIAANAVALHKDHIVGHLFLISYRPNWRYLGMRESAAKSFVDEVEAAWTEYCDGIFGEMDAEGKRTFTEFIREGVGVHAFNGEIFLQPVWDAETTQVFRTRFKAVSPKRVDTPGYARGNRQLRAGVETDRNGKALAYHVCDDDWPVAGGERWTRIPRFLPSGRPAMLHIFEPVEDGQTRGANQFYSVMERLKMLDTLQATQLQSAIVKAMYAATIESELDSEKAFEYITAADNKDTPLVNMLANYARYYSTNSIKLGGVKIPHLYPGDELNLQTAQDSDNGFSALEQALLRYIAAGLGVSYEQLSRDYSQVSYSSARASANESWRYFLGRRRFIAGRLATQMFSCWLEEALIRGVIRAPRARFSFWEARSSWSRSEWIGAGRMAIDGLKEVQEAVMRIEAGLSTYEKELAIMGEDCGFEMNGKGAAARPSLKVSNLYGMVTGMVEDLHSLVGATVIRRIVYARFLDAVNFQNGNQEADPEQESVSRWVIEQCSDLTAVSATFVLATPTETDGCVFPGRIMLANTCTWIYRSDECGYTGPAVADEFDNPTADPAKDACSRCARGCALRNNTGNFGGFLSINKLSQ